MELIKEIGAFAGLAAFLGLALLALLSFTHGRDIRRLREWAGSAPERDAERKEAASAAAAQRAEEMRRVEEARRAEQQLAALREERRRRREAGLPETTRRERFRERLSEGGSRLAEPWALAAIFACVVLVCGVAAYAVLHGLGGSGGAKATRHTAMSAGEIEVSVLNGTAVPGLAARFGDEVERKGFSLGAVTNSRTSFTKSVVMFSRGHAPEARRVAKALGITQVQLMTPDIDSVSAGATVSVVVGEDNAAAGP